MAIHERISLLSFNWKCGMQLENRRHVTSFPSTDWLMIFPNQAKILWQMQLDDVRKFNVLKNRYMFQLTWISIPNSWNLQNV